MDGIFTVDGVTGSVKTLAKAFGVPYETLRYRIATGMSLEAALRRGKSRKTTGPKLVIRRKVVFVRVGSSAGYYTWEEEK